MLYFSKPEIVDDKYKEYVNSDVYMNTGGGCYVLYIELVYCNRYVTFAANEDSYSIYNHSFKEYHDLLDAGETPEELKTDYGCYVWTYDDYFPIRFELDLELNGQDYPKEVYDFIANRVFKYFLDKEF